MKVLYTADPASNFAGLLVSVFDRVDVDGGSARHILTLHILQFQNRFVFVVKAGLVQHGDSQIFLGAIWLGHLEEGINLTDCGDVVRDERLDLRVQLNLLRLVPLDVLKHFLEFRRNGQVRVCIWVVRSWHLLLVVIIFIVVLRTLLTKLLLRGLLLLLLLSLGLYIDIDIDFVLLLVRVNLLGVVHVDCKVEGLVVHLLSFDIGGGLGATGLRVSRNVRLHGLAHGVVA